MIVRLKSLIKTDLGKIFTGNVLVQVITVLQAVIVSRILGPQGKGEFIAIILWPTIISGISILGLYTGIAKLSARDMIFDHWNMAKSTLIATTIVGLIGTMVSLVLSPHLIEIEDSSESVLSLTLIFSVFVLINNVARGFNAIDHGRKDFTRYSVTRSILNPIFFIFLLVLYFTKTLSLATVVISLLSANFIVCLVRVILSLYAEREKRKCYPVARIFKYSLKYSISDLSEPIYTYFDKAILALVLFSYDLGIYTTAYSAASLIAIFSNVYGTKVFSDLAGGSSAAAINVMLRQNLILMGIAAVGLVFIIPLMVPIVFGYDFSPAILPAIILLATCILQGQSYIVERGILALGFPYAGAKAKGISMITLTALAFTCKWLGFINIYVMVAIITICQGCYFAYMLLQYRKLCHIHLDIIPNKTDFNIIFSRIISRR